MSELEEARTELDQAYQKVRDDLGEVHVAFEAVMAAGPTDDLHELLKTLEREVKEARDGGLLKSGANDHRRALKRFRELGG